MIKRDDSSKQLYLLFRKLSLNKLLDVNSLSSELDTLSKIERRNRPQQHTRKYLRLTRQLCSRLPIHIQKIKGFAARSVSVSESLSARLECEETLLRLYYESQDLHQGFSNTRQFILNLLREIQFYLVNTEFVRVLMVLIALASKIYCLLAQPLPLLRKVCNVLQATLRIKQQTGKQVITARGRGHDHYTDHRVMPRTSGQGEPVTGEDPGELVTGDGSGEILSDEESGESKSDEYLGELVSTEDLGELVSMEDLGEPVSMEDIGEPVSVDECLPSDNLFDSSKRDTVTPLDAYVASLQHSSLEQADVSRSVEHDSRLKCKSSCQVSRRITVRLKRPTYKVYKQRHPWLRKIAKYSSDYLRQSPPDYSYSLYLSC